MPHDNTEPMFDVFLSGDLLPGFEPTTVAAGIAKLFKVDQAAADRLVDGQRHRVKSGCDKKTALAYRSALSELGAKVAVERHASSGAGGANPAAPASAATSSADAPPSADAIANEPRPTPAAQSKIETSPSGQASFEAQDPGSHVIDYESPEAPVASASSEAAISTGSISTGSISTGSISPESRESLSIAPVGSLMSEQVVPVPPVKVALPDYDVAPAGEPIPSVPVHQTPLNPVIDHLHLEPQK